MWGAAERGPGVKSGYGSPVQLISEQPAFRLCLGLFAQLKVNAKVGHERQPRGMEPGGPAPSTHPPAPRWPWEPCQFKATVAQSRADSGCGAHPYASAHFWRFHIFDHVSVGRFLSGDLLLLQQLSAEERRGDAGSPHVGRDGAPSSEPTSASGRHHLVNEKHAWCFRLIWFPAKTNEPRRSHFRGAAGDPLVL